MAMITNILPVVLGNFMLLLSANYLCRIKSPRPTSIPCVDEKDRTLVGDALRMIIMNQQPLPLRAIIISNSITFGLFGPKYTFGADSIERYDTVLGILFSSKYNKPISVTKAALEEAIQVMKS